MTTHPQVIRQLGIILKERGYQVEVADTPVGKSDYERREKLWEVTGVNAILKELGLKRNDLEERLVMQNIMIDEALVSFPISSDIFDSQVINIPKFKTHGFMLFTGCVKNLYGVLPEYSKKRLHRELEEKSKFSKLLLELYRMVDCRLHVMDAVVGIQGEGPGAKGEPRHIGLIIVSEDGVALDMVAEKIMNIDSNSIPTNLYAQKIGIGHADLSSIDIVGDNIEDFIITDYKLPVINRHTDRLTNKLFHLSRYAVEVMQDKCRKCGLCIQNCPSNAMEMIDDKISIISEKCKSCLVCHEICPFGAIEFTRYSFLDELSKKEEKAKKEMQNQKKWILIFGNPDSQNMFRKIKARGYHIILIYDKKPRTDFTLCDKVLEDIDFSKIQGSKLAGIVNIHSERGVIRCAQACEYFNLPGYSVRQAEILSNKKLLKSFLLENNINTPKFSAFHNYQELMENLKRFIPPYVLKPVDNSNTRGVFLFNNEKISEDIFNQALSYSESKEVLLEEFVDGDEYDVTCIVYDYGIVYLFVNKRIRFEKGQYFGKAIGFQTVELPDNKMQELMHLCRKSIKALNIKSAVVSFQVIDGEKGFTVIEMAGRLMGGGIFEFIYFVTGIDMDSILLDLALDNQIRDIFHKRKPRSAAYLFADSIIGRPKNISMRLEGFEEARKVSGVFLLNIKENLLTCQDTGEQYKELSGGVLCINSCAETALESAFNSLSKLKWVE